MNIPQDLTIRLRDFCAEAWVEVGAADPHTQLILFERQGKVVIRAVAKIATLEDMLCAYPKDWWQAFKDRWFPKWLKRHYPVETNDVWAVHKFPDLGTPLGRERIHLEVRYAKGVAGQRDNHNLQSGGQDGKHLDI